MRLFLLRLLISWWMIPISWTVIFAFLWLMAGWHEAVAIAEDLTHSFWYGM